jgi:uncharacterized protein YacL
MLPILFEISGQKINISGLFLGISIIIYIFSGWVYFRKELETIKIFDILFLSIFNFVFFSRFLGVIENIDLYTKDLSKIFDFRDNNFSFVGLFIGLIISVIFINKLLIKHHQSKRGILEHTFMIFFISVIPLLLGSFLSGRMLGVEDASGVGLLYDDGVKRLPIGIFRIIFFFLSLIAYLVIRIDKTRRLTNSIGGFFMVFAVFEIVINTFIKDFSPSIFGVMNIEQLNACLIFFLGIIILLEKKFSEIAFDEQEGMGRRTREERYSNNHYTDYSYSFKDIDFSINQSELSIKEKFRISINSIKRKFKK